MSGLGNYLLNGCYSGVLCIAIIIYFLFANKRFEKKIVRYFLALSILTLIYVIGAKTESFLGEQETFHYARFLLSWLDYILGPGILLLVTELFLRNRSKKIKYLVAIPELINVLVASTAFFAPWCFSFDTQVNHWRSGPLGFVPTVTLIIYLLMLLLLAILNFRKSRGECLIIILACLFLAGIMVAEDFSDAPVSLREITVALALLAYFMYFASMSHMDEVQELNAAFMEEKMHNSQMLVDQCIETLAYTIDAKDRYTRGHSARVAKYSRMIATLDHKSEEECRKIYLTGLLHDIGKIAINDSIINKPGKLNDEEFAVIKKHPAKGAKILEKMKGLSYLRDGANYHHERYDGKGYPSGLSGNNIPEYARIIAVADAYDAMSSNRSYRSALDQVVVKQEIWKGSGTQFDPYFAKLMISLIDADVNYDMREKTGEKDEILIEEDQEDIIWPTSMPQKIAAETEQMQETEYITLAAYIMAEDHWSKPGNGLPAKEEPAEISFRSCSRDFAKYVWNAPVILIYSSDDGRALGDNYEELAVIMCGGYSWRSGSTVEETINVTRNEGFVSWDNWIEKNRTGLDYTVRAKRKGSIVTVTVENECLNVTETVELPADYSKNVYIAAAGESCDIYYETVD